MDMEFNLSFHALRLIAGANMADKDEIKSAIKSLEETVNTRYYDDQEGDYLLRQIVSYFKTKL